MPPTWYLETLNALLSRRNLTSAEVRQMMAALMAAELGDVEAGALLIALRTKGETAEEVAVAAEILRENMVPLATGRDDVLDTCGTGGDGSGTFNISTATALVVAGHGVPVVKHGNRAMSSQSGSADVLAALGVHVQGDAASARHCLERVGLAFCFAPHFHPALANVGPVRRRLKIRTIFNCLGPLANPARAPFQLIGTGNAELLDVMAGALAHLGARHAYLVCGRDGLDEVTLSAATIVREVRQGQVSAHEWTPDDFGLAPCSLADLRVSGPEESAAVIRGILAGEDEPAMRVVLANAAAALLAVGEVASLRHGVTLAREAISSGAAASVLSRLVEASRERG
jgi:anthranilate phosphoribosyltransferase